MLLVYASPRASARRGAASHIAWLNWFTEIVRHDTRWPTPGLDPRARIVFSFGVIEEIWDKIMGGKEMRSRVEEIAQSIHIPSQPKIMQEINLEFARSDANFTRISDLVCRDVGLSAKVLRVANSPLFAPKAKIEAIGQALMLLGAKRFKQTILASALRQSMEETGDIGEEFWVHSETVGVLCERIAREFHLDIAEYAYLTGLFHDCAIPVLLHRGENYGQLLPRVLGRDRFVAAEEEEQSDIDHGSLGLVMTRSWSVPLPVVRAIRAHHTDNFRGHDDAVALRLHVILSLAENYYLYCCQLEDDVFGGPRNMEYVAAIQAATGWTMHKILSLAHSLAGDQEIP